MLHLFSNYANMWFCLWLHINLHIQTLLLDMLPSVCSNKKKVSTEGGMVIPEDGKRVKKSYLADSDSKAASKAAADGAPPGFPNGADILLQFPCNSCTASS